MKIKRIIIELIAFILFILFIYSSTSKYLEFPAYQNAMKIQPLSPLIQEFLIYLLPPLEIGIACLLVLGRTKIIGFVISLGTLFLFTFYITLIKLNFYGKIPCTCGGVIKRMTWTQHLFFNIFFIAITLVGLLLLLLNKKGEVVMNKENRLLLTRKL